LLTKAERLLGRMALERGVIGPDALSRAIEAKERGGASAGDLVEILVEQGALTRAQQRALSEAARDAGRRRAAVKWAVEQAGKSFEAPAEGDLPFVVENEGAWAGVAEVEIPPAGAIPPPPPPAAAPPPNVAVEEDLAIAKIAMERGLVTLAEVRESLQAQADFAAIGRPLPLGQVLIKRRAIDIDTFVNLTREARARSVRCASCGVLSLLPRVRASGEALLEGRCPRCSAPLPLTGGHGGATSTPSPVSLPPKRTDRGVPYRPRVEQAGIPLGTPPPAAPPRPPPAAAPPPAPEPAPEPAPAPEPRREPAAAAPPSSSTEGRLDAPIDIPLPDLDVPLDPFPGPALTSAEAPLLRPSSDPFGIHPDAFAPGSSSDLDFSGVKGDAPAPEAPRPAPAVAPPAAAPPPAADLVSAAAPPKGALAGPKVKKPRGESLAGQAFGRYEILTEIARGGMGIVYRAKEKEGDGRVVALKVLKDGVTASDKQVRRFKRETEAVVKLKHPSIVPIFDVGCENGRHYFTMAFVDGLPVDELIRRGPVEVDKALQIAEETARGIHHAHERGVIHRDIKPANILLDRSGKPHITDFGLAKNVDRVSAMTKTGAAVGTPFYMPPEQAKGDSKHIDHRVDVYAIGVVLYEMLTSELPFDGETTLEVYHKILQDEVPLPSRLNAAVDAEVDTIVGKCLAKEKSERYESALALADDIRRKLDGRKIEARPPGAISVAAKRVRRIGPSAAMILGAVALAALVAGGVIYVKKSNEEKAQAQALTQAVDAEWAEVQRRLREPARRAESELLVAQARLKEGRTADAAQAADRGIALLSDPRSWLQGERAVRHEERNGPRAAALLAQVEATELPAVLGELWVLKGRALAVAGDREGALVAFDRAIQSDPARAEGHIERGRTLSALGRVRDAEASFGRAADARRAARESASEALLLRGLARAALGLSEEAIADFALVEEAERAAAPGRTGPALVSTTEGEPTRFGAASIGRARALAALGRTADAIAITKALIGIDPGLTAAFVAASDIEREGGDLRAALQHAEDACAADQKRPDGEVARGRAHLAAGELGLAREAFTRALVRNPRHAPALLFRSIGFDWDLDPPSVSEISAAERAALDLRRIAEAPRGADLWPRALVALRDAEALRAAAETSAEGARAVSVTAGFTGGAPGLFHGNPAPIIGLYDAAIALDPLLSAAYIAKARLLARTGDFEGARGVLDRAATIPRDTAAYENALGLVALARGEAARAAEYFAAAREHAPGQLYPEAVANEGHALLRTGDAARARRAFARALDQEAQAAHLTPTGTARGAGAGDGEGGGRERPGGIGSEAERCARIAVTGHLGSRPDAEAAVLLRLGVAAGARTAIERAAGLAPGMSRAWLALEGSLRDVDADARRARLHALDRAVHANPDHAEARLLRGRERLKPLKGGAIGAAAAEGAREDLDAVLAIDPERVAARFERARALLLLGDLRRAEEDLERVIGPIVRGGGKADGVVIPQFYEARAALRRAQSKNDLAESDLRRARLIEEGDRTAAIEKAREADRLLRGGRNLDAIALAGEAIALDERCSIAWIVRLNSRYMLGHSLGAALDAAHALELDSGFADRVFDQTSERSDHFDLSKIHEAVEAHLATSPDDLYALFLRGLHGTLQTYKGEAKPEDRERSLAALDRVIRYAPEFTFAFVCRGYLLLHRGDLDGAFRDVTHAESLDDRSVLSPFLVALVHAKRGQAGAALDALERAAARGFKNLGRLKAEPAFAIVRDDARWAALLARVETNGRRPE